MRKNKVKAVLGRGGGVVGTMVFEFSTSGIAHIAAEAGAEFVLFDMEHTGWSVETVRSLLSAARSAEIASFVRVPASEYHFLAGVMEAGAQGVMVPMVESAEEARHVVRSVKYPPAGRRGAAFGIAHDDYTGGDIATKARSANEEGLVILQIETAAGVDNVEEIAGVDGVDVLWVGQTDLSSSLGIPGQFAHPKFIAALERVVAASEARGKAAGYMALSPQEGRDMKEKGFRCLAYAGDLWIYKEALRQGIAAVRG